MSEVQHYQSNCWFALEHAIQGELDYLSKVNNLEAWEKNVCHISPISLSAFVQSILKRLTLTNNGCHELCNLVRSLGEDGEVAFSCNFTYGTDNEDPHDSLHISNVPRIKELNNHVFSTLQKGQDLF